MIRGICEFLTIIGFFGVIAAYLVAFAPSQPVMHHGAYVNQSAHTHNMPTRKE